MSKFNLTQKQTARLIELIMMGSDVVGASLELSLEFTALLEASGAVDVQKSAKSQIVQHPEIDVTFSDLNVGIKTIPNKTYKLDVSKVFRDEAMTAIYNAQLERKREQVEVTATDMNLRSSRAQDLRFLMPVISPDYKMKIERCKKA